MVLRVISGTLRGKKLNTLPGSEIRPTADRTKESIFNVLSDSVREAQVLDLFAGTGSLSIEALSRGARQVVAIDKSRSAIEVIRKNLAACRMSEQVRLVEWDIIRNLDCIKASIPPFTLVFMDPPYAAPAIEPALSNLHSCGALKIGAVVVIEHDFRVAAPETRYGFNLCDKRKYGKTLVSFFRYMI
ncbi:MAG: 16S rRNA (guanine(966)-N(2))-methyltransferase RsmD [Desulfobacteraceae bacterium]|nr:16S rRNA (guanine(966)-N(2))-methyltransferase RsmD [Desulfobacteraceae bacterium]